MATKNDRELRREITYLTKLIERHKKTSAIPQSRPSRPPKQTTNRFKWTSTSGSSPHDSSSVSSSGASRHPSSAPQPPCSSGKPSSTPFQSRTVLPPRQNTLPPKNPKVYCYSNQHHHGNLQYRRPGNQHHIDRKWSNMVYLPGNEVTAKSKSTKDSLAEIPNASTTGPPPMKKTGSIGGGEKRSHSSAVQSDLCGRGACVGGHPASSHPSHSHTTKPTHHLSQTEQQQQLNQRKKKPTAGGVCPPLPPPLPSPSPSHPLPPRPPPPSSPSPSHLLRHRTGSASGGSSKYRWRRRSTPSSPSFTKRKLATTKSTTPRSGLKSPTSGGGPRHLTPSWVIHNKYKLTHASIVHKYARIMQRQRSTAKLHLGRSATRRTPSLTANKKSRAKNKVWRASDERCGRSDPQFSTPSRRLSGHELKTRQGNRQWVAKRVRRSGGSVQAKGTTPQQSLLSSSSSSAGSHPVRRLTGRELKTRQGNRQWVARGVVARRRKSLQLVVINNRFKSASVYGGGTGSAWRRRSGYGRGRRNSVRSMQLVSLSGGQKFVVDSGGRRMKRVSLSSPITSSSSPHSLRPRLRSRSKTASESQPSPSSTTIKQYLASRVVQRSRVYVWSARQRKKREAKQYCIFYNRFGKCNRGNACPYIHDPTKIAICTKFLRGMCDKTDGSCLFSHTMSKDKLPTCSFFLRGVCTREVCPYRHVSVGRHAEICLDFARGYCPNGEECPKQHVVDCPDFAARGRCPRRDKCPLRHRTVKVSVKQQLPHPVPATRTPLAFKRLRRKVVPESGPEKGGTGTRRGVVEAHGGRSRDEGAASGDGSCDGGDGDDGANTRQLSPLDPSCPGRPKPNPF